MSLVPTYDPGRRAHLARAGCPVDKTVELDPRVIVDRDDRRRRDRRRVTERGTIRHPDRATREALWRRSRRAGDRRRRPRRRSATTRALAEPTEPRCPPPPTPSHAFEKLIVRELMTTGGWLGEDTNGAPTEHRNYDAALGLYPDDLVAFVKRHPGQGVGQARRRSPVRAQRAHQPAASASAEQLDKRGTIDLLRDGVHREGRRAQAGVLRARPRGRPDGARSSTRPTGCGSCAKCASTRTPATASTWCCSSTASRPRPRS